MYAREPSNIATSASKTTATNTRAAGAFAAQGDSATTGGRGDVKAAKKVVRFNDVVEVFHFEKSPTPQCLMLIQAKYADMIGDVDDRRICRAARLTGCTARLNTSIARRNKHGDLCFVVTVEGRRDSDVRRFKNLIRDRFPDIFFPSA
ncbi:unnamed protein product [Rodentolepis nana]|uniref:SUI1 domain-containing protein n=1 Tax=Rodentolepis nana TaxID=102285 RepID=A0A0R3TJL5_RODNA|nr:unnamed protein product [Rodentolepis nana]